ncbi:ankycorbin [Drosophila albomicans]|uniref:Ankycorbin n=1 Tax=Drosophila albomicans TaxID=7291 RepID=A0A6P8XS56_DROAB|nr:ankycorbin [Drosophila albomicans]
MFANTLEFDVVLRAKMAHVNLPQLLRQRDRSNRNALHYCAAQDLEQTRDLVAAASIAIAAPELLESADEDGFTPLHLAVIQGNLAMVNLLLANKADVNAVDNEGHSVVHWATVCGEIEALRAVLAAGASVAKPDVNGGTPLHYAAQMCGASYDSKLQSNSNSSKLALEILGILLSHPQTSVDVQDKDGRQPLLWAASAGSAKAVIALVKAGARVESCDKDGLTALHCAASRGHTECIDTLISLCGAPTDLIDSNGCTALHYAVTLGHADATARLLDLEADPNRQDRKGRTPAHCGCSKGQFETLKLLKERGANLWLRNAKGDLPLHEAAASGRRELLEWLLVQRPKQVNTTSNDGRSLLHISAANDYTDMCKLLLDYGGDVNALYRNSRGIVLTPLDCALQRGHRSTAKFLQSHGGQPSSKLRLAARRGNPFHEGAAADPVRPLKYVEKEEVHDLRSSKKYVVYLKRTDSDGNAEQAEEEGEGDDCSCTEQSYRKEQRLQHICRRHKRRQLRRRTNSCGENKHEKCSDICRSKSNIEIRRRKSRERYASTSDCDNDEDEDEEEDSCENCCYHKRQKQRVVQRKRTVSTRRCKSEKLGDSEEEEHSEGEKQDKKSAEESKKVEIAKESSEDKGQIATATTAAIAPATTAATPPATSEGTFIKSPPQSAKSEKPAEPAPESLKVAETNAVELTDEEQEAAKSVVTQVDVHHDAAEESPDAKQELSEEDTKLVSNEVEQMIKIAATALSSESKSSTDDASVKEQPEPAKEPPATEEAVKPEVVAAETVVAAAPTPTATPTPSVAKPATAEQPQQQQPTEKQLPVEAEKPVQLPAEPKVSESKVAPTPKTTPTTSTSNPTPSKPQTEPKNPQQKPPAAQPQPQQQQQPQPQPPPQQPQREQESRRSFTLLPSDSADDEPSATVAPSATTNNNNANEPERKSSFTVLKSDESMGELEDSPRPKELDFASNSQVFQVMHDGNGSSKLPSASELDKGEYDYEEYDEGDDDDGGIDPEHDSALRRFLSSGNRHGVAGDAGEIAVTSDVTGYDGLSNGRKRRLKKRVRSGAKTRSNWKHAQESRDSSNAAGLATTSKDQDSGFEPSPRAERTKIPTPRSSHTAMPRRPIYATLDGRSCSSRLENRKPGDKGACDMGAVTRSIQRNIRRYYMERKIFQHLLELKSLQIRSNKLNESVLVKRAVDDYHKSCVLLGGETGTRLRRYNFSEYTFKNFELFLYETLKGLQKPGTNNFQNINEVYEEAERRLSPDYNAYEKALQCTTKTHRCLHAAHAYTGIPCAAYIPMMNHHTMPKFGFGPYKKAGSVSSFYLPKILTSGRATSGRTGGGSGGGGGVGVDIGVGFGGLGGGGKCSHKVALELSHGKSKQLISLPADKLDSNKRYYVTFTVKDSPGQSAVSEAHKQSQQQQQQLQRQSSCAGGDASGK